MSVALIYLKCCKRRCACVCVCVGAFMTQQWTPLQVKSYPEECSLTDVFACHSSFPLTGIRARGRRHADRSSKCFVFFCFVFAGSNRLSPTPPCHSDTVCRLFPAARARRRVAGTSAIAASCAVAHVHGSNDRLLHTVNRSSV